MLTFRQKTLVRKSFERVAPVHLGAADHFYDRLFTLDPTLRPLFGDDMAAQRRKLMDMLAVAVANLDHLGRVVPAVEALGRRHVEYGVRPEPYDTVGSALIWTLERCLGPSFTYEAPCAWIETYLLIAATMQRTMPALAA